MRQAVIYVSLCGSLILYMLTINLFESMLLFVLFGLMPGSEQQLSAAQMLTIHGVIGSALASYVARRHIRNAARALSTSRLKPQTS